MVDHGGLKRHLGHDIVCVEGDKGEVKLRCKTCTEDIIVLYPRNI